MKYLRQYHGLLQPIIHQNASIYSKIQENQQIQGFTQKAQNETFQGNIRAYHALFPSIIRPNHSSNIYYSMAGQQRAVRRGVQQEHYQTQSQQQHLLQHAIDAGACSKQSTWFLLLLWTMAHIQIMVNFMALDTRFLYTSRTSHA